MSLFDNFLNQIKESPKSEKVHIPLYNTIEYKISTLGYNILFIYLY